MNQERIIDLDSEQRRTLKRIIETHIPNKKVWAYGSRVKWKASVGADLDLVIFGCDVSTLAAFREALEESNLVISVDVMNWEKIPDDFKKNIKQKYIVLQEKKMLEGWLEVKLAVLGKVITGKTPSLRNPEDWGDKMPFVTPTDYKNYGKFAFSAERMLSEEGIKRLKNKILPPNSVMVTCIGYYTGKIAMNKTSVITNQQINSIIPNIKIINSNFLYYSLMNTYEHFQALSSSSTAVPIINKGIFEKISLIIPSLSEQKTIVEILGSLDEKIDLLCRQNKILETAAQIIFRKHIVNNPNYENWKRVKFAEVYDFLKGCEPGSVHYQGIKSDKNIRFIRVRDMLENAGNIYIPKDRADITCEKTDLLVSFDGTVGKVAYGVIGAFSSGIRKIISLSDIYNNLGLKYLLFTNKYIQNTIQQHAIGTVILHASGAIQYLNFRLPDEKELTSFNLLITPIFDKIIHNQEQIHALGKARDRLLPKIMSGKARVK